MKKAIILIGLFLFKLHVLAQPFNVDSLRKRIESSKADTNKVLMLGKLSTYYNHNHLDSGFYLVQQMITLSQQLKYSYGEAWGLSILSTSADRTGDMTKSFEIALSCLHLSEKLSYGKDEMMTRAYTQMGVVNFMTGHYEEARSYLRQALSSAKRYYPNETSYYQVYAHIGNAFRRQGLLDSAVYYTDKAYALSLHSPERYFYTYVRNCEGEVNEALGKLDTARMFYHAAVVEGIRIKHFFQLSYAYSQLSNLFNKIGDLDSSIYFAKKSLGLSQSYFYGLFISLATNHLSQAFEKLHMPDSALKYLKVTMEVREKVMNQNKQQQFQLLAFEEQQRQEKINIAHQQYKIKVRTFVLIGGLVVMLVLLGLLYRNNRSKQRSNKQLLKKTKELQKTMQDLRETQYQLVQSEKMASLGELTAGIAHEIQNPLNFVNNFSEVNEELIKELKNEAVNGNISEVKAIVDDIASNSEKINHHGKRAEAIVKNMLQHSRTSTGHRELTDLNTLCDEYLRLAFHGMRAKDKSFNAEIRTDFDRSLGKINLVPQDIGRVILNLINNAFYTVNEKAASCKLLAVSYEPRVVINTRKIGDKVEIRVEDNGNGIPQKILDKIFQPFFTTKPTGQGTGLGLSLSYDIIKAHGGELIVETKDGEGLPAEALAEAGTIFTIALSSKEI